MVIKDIPLKVANDEFSLPCEAFVLDQCFFPYIMLVKNGENMVFARPSQGEGIQENTVKYNNAFAAENSE